MKKLVHKNYRFFKVILRNHPNYDRIYKVHRDDIRMCPSGCRTIPPCPGKIRLPFTADDCWGYGRYLKIKEVKYKEDKD